MNFELLVNTIQETHTTLQQSAVKAINKHLTIRNWLVGFYIVEFEQNGEDRAKYGQKLIPELAKNIKLKGLSETNLILCRQFYQTYTEIGQVIAIQLKSIGFNVISIPQTLSDELQIIGHQPIINLKTLLPSTIRHSELQVAPEKIINNLSYSHLVLLFPINDALKRTFYEVECMKGNWSVSELKRQINTLYFERSGMSNDPEKLSRMVQVKSETLLPTDILKSPFTFEFLGLKAKDVVYESDLEQALIDHLEEFLLELGHGFCFESKQKRIIIGDEYYFIDLVFYHRILKCHVLVELKTNEVKHEHIGQLKTYINYYKKEIMLPGDNPPVGILLVTENKKALVEYAVADSDQSLFVNKYLLELPSKQQLIDFIKREITS